MFPSIKVYAHLYWMCKMSWLLVFMLVFVQHAAQGFPTFERSNCGPSFSVDPRTCIHGAFNFNVNKTMCPPSMACYRNLGETCQVDAGISNCLPPLVCSCNRCREMYTADICNQKLQSPFYLPKRMKPIYPEYVY